MLYKKEQLLEDKLCKRHCTPLVRLFKSFDDIGQLDDSDAFCADVLAELTKYN